MTNFNERTNSLLYKNISHASFSKSLMLVVWEVSWRRGQIAKYWPQVLLTIAALLSYLGWVAQPWVTEGPKPSVCRWLSRWHLVPNWLQLQLELELPRAPGYIIVLRTPASAVLPLIYTGASLDWRLGRGSICYTCGASIQKYGHNCGMKNMWFISSNGLDFHGTDNKSIVVLAFASHV